MNSLPEYAINPWFETNFEPFFDLPGFFPGAGGFFHGCTSGQPKPFIFYGTDFGQLSYQKTLATTGGEPRANQSLLKLRQVIEQAGLDPCACHLTNAVLGLTKGEEAVGNYDAMFKNHPDYLIKCGHWHQEWLAINKPRLVVLMGTPHLKDYGKRIFPELERAWAGHTTLKSVYSARKELVKIDNGPDVLLMYHPSFWHLHPSSAKQRVVTRLSEYAI